MRSRSEIHRAIATLTILEPADNCILLVTLPALRSFLDMPRPKAGEEVVVEMPEARIGMALYQSICDITVKWAFSERDNELSELIDWCEDKLTQSQAVRENTDAWGAPL